MLPDVLFMLQNFQSCLVDHIYLCYSSDCFRIHGALCVWWTYLSLISFCDSFGWKSGGCSGPSHSGKLGARVKLDIAWRITQIKRDFLWALLTSPTLYNILKQYGSNWDVIENIRKMYFDKLAQWVELSLTGFNNFFPYLHTMNGKHYDHIYDESIRFRDRQCLTWCISCQPYTSCD